MDMEQSELQAILEEFVTEAEEGLEELEQNLIKLEDLAANGETDAETVDVIFRTLHTLKGGAGFLGLGKMQSLAHAGENLLDEVRSHNVDISTEVMNALLSTNDVLKELLEAVRNQEDEDSIETEDLTLTLKQLASNKKESKAVDQPNSDVQINQELLDEINADPLLAGDLQEAKDEVIANLAEPTKTADIKINQDLIDEINADPRLEGAPVQSQDTKDDIVAEDGSHINQSLLDEINSDPLLGGTGKKVVENGESIEIAAAEKLNKRGDDRRKGNEERRKAGRRKNENAETTIRVETGRLDQVMNLVGELVLARNALVRQLKSSEAQKVLNQLDNASLVTSNLELLSRVSKDLQKSVLHTRMQPIKKVFDKIPRQVRELKAKLGREVNLIIEGEMTEVDKTLVEELSDPMVHLIRNALDHGIETKQDRIEVGKDPEGTLIIRAFYEGNNIVIQVAEDGKGMDADILKQLAVERGVIDENQAANMQDKDAYRLVLEPGFSTAKEISDVSGRGVGMDVVNSKITAIKGSIDIESELGKGTTVSIYVPLTLAIVQALIVRSGCEGFAIPIGSISEVVNYNTQMVHDVNGNDVVEIRGEVIPLFYLSELTKNSGMDIKNDDLDTVLRKASVPQGTALAKSIAQGRESKSEGYIIIVRDASMVVGVCIDGLIGQEEAVVKSITEMFDYNPAISGATITGDGSVHMILDVPYLMRDIHRNGSLKF